MANVIELLTPSEYQAVYQPCESGSVERAAEHLGKSANVLWKQRSTARAKLKAAGYTLPDLRKQKRSGCKRVPSLALSV